MASSALLQKIRRLQGKPPFLVWQALLRQVPGRPLRIARFFVLMLPEAPKRELRGFGHLRKGMIEDIPGMCALEKKNAEVFSRRFREGEECVVAYDGGRIVGYLWFSSKDSHLEERFGYRLPIPPDAIYSYDAFIDPDYRIRGIWVLFQKYMLERARQMGRKRIMAIVDLGNDHSFNSHLRFGYRLEKIITFMRFINIKFFRESAPDARPAMAQRGTP